MQSVLHHLGRTVEKVDSVLQWFAPLLFTYHIEKFLFLDAIVYHEAVKLFYANMTISEDDDPTVHSFVFAKHIKFNLILLCESLTYRIPKTLLSYCQR